MAYGTNGSSNGSHTRVSEWKIKEQMCDIGRRIWIKGFCAGNEGNHSYRIGENRVLCTPTGMKQAPARVLGTKSRMQSISRSSTLMSSIPMLMPDLSGMA